MIISDNNEGWWRSSTRKVEKTQSWSLHLLMTWIVNNFWELVKYAFNRIFGSKVLPLQMRLLLVSVADSCSCSWFSVGFARRKAKKGSDSKVLHWHRSWRDLNRLSQSEIFPCRINRCCEVIAFFWQSNRKKILFARQLDLCWQKKIHKYTITWQFSPLRYTVSVSTGKLF